MFKPIPVAIGLRYLRAKRRNGFISFISLASILGIALGVAALITTMAVMSGFQREIRDRMLQMAAHATVSGYGEPVQDWPHAVEAAVADKRVAGAAPYVEKEALLSGARNQPALVRGVMPAEEGKVSVLGRQDGRRAGSRARARQLQHRARPRAGAVAGRGGRRQRGRDHRRLPQHADGCRRRSSSASPSAASSRPATTSSTRAWPSSTCRICSACCAWARASPACG